jgi:hypothetical protein
MTIFIVFNPPFNAHHKQQRLLPILKGRGYQEKRQVTGTLKTKSADAF